MRAALCVRIGDIVGWLTDQAGPRIKDLCLRSLPKCMQIGIVRPVRAASCNRCASAGRSNATSDARSRWWLLDSHKMDHSTSGALYIVEEGWFVGGLCNEGFYVFRTNGIQVQASGVRVAFASHTEPPCIGPLRSISARSYLNAGRIPSRHSQSKLRHISDID